MAPRRTVLAAALLALAGLRQAAAQDQPSSGARLRPRRRQREDQQVQAPPPSQRGDPAPMPDPNVRAPRDPSADNPSVDARIFNPRMFGTGAAMQDDQAARYRDRLHAPAAGAAFRVPF